MSSVINTNISSLNAQRNLGTSQTTLQTSLQRLSTGLRINSAKDDSAGLAIATRMSAQIGGMQQASRNANDGISMSQTAEGGMSSVNDILLRMRDLAVQASNGSNGTKERSSIQNEMDQLSSEIDRISGSTEFNGIKLLNGSAKNNTIQVGANAGQTISFSIGEVSTKAMKLNSTSALGDLNSGRVTGTAPAAGNAELEINGTGVTMAVTDTTAKAQAVKINAATGQTGVTASAYNSVQGTVGATGVTSGLTINGTTIDDSSSLSDLVDKINKQAGGVTASIGTHGELSLTNDDGSDITVGGTVNGSGLSAATNHGYLSLKSGDGTAIALTGTALGKFGFNESTGASNVVSGAVTGTAVAKTDDVRINGVQVGDSASGTAADIANAINAISDQTGVKASAKTTVNNTVDMSDMQSYAFAGDGTDQTINGVAVDFTGSQNIADVVSKINGAGIQGVTASADKDGNLVLTSETGLDIDVSNGTGLLTSGTTHGKITLTSETGTDIRLSQKSGGTGLAAMGLVAQGGNSETVGGKLSVMSQANASTAITAIDNAISYVAEQRATMGAVQNRLNTAVSNLATQSENITSARSRIQDADFAQETANMTRAQILQQAGTAMLAQANSLPNGVLSLLRG